MSTLNPQQLTLALANHWKKTPTQVAALSRVLQEKETLLSAAVRSSAETEELLATVGSLTAERDQLKVDLHENIEMVGDYPPNASTRAVLQLFLGFPVHCFLPFVTQMIENQDELRSTLNQNRELKERLKKLEAAASIPDVPQSGSDAQLDELQTKVRMAFFYVLRSSFTHDSGNIRFDF